MKVQLTTANYGGYEKPKPLPADLGVPAVMYTDDPDIVAPGWEVRCVPLYGITDGMLRAKWWKTQPHLAAPGMDATIWLDSTMTIRVPAYVEKCVAALGVDELSFMRHPERDCVYTEAEFSSRLPRYFPAKLAEQTEAYRQQGHPPHWGLFATGNMVVRHTDEIQTAFNEWWLENISRTWQDQVSLPVILRNHQEEVSWNTNIPWWTWWDYTEHGQ